MNASQNQSLEAFTTSQLDSDHEVKSLSTSEWDTGEVWATVEFGRKNDEGTMGEVLCRSRFSVLIGKRGGIQIQMAPRWAKGLGKVGGARLASNCHYSA